MHKKVDKLDRDYHKYKFLVRLGAANKLLKVVFRHRFVFLLPQRATRQLGHAVALCRAA